MIYLEKAQRVHHLTGEGVWHKATVPDSLVSLNPYGLIITVLDDFIGRAGGAISAYHYENQEHYDLTTVYMDATSIYTDGKSATLMVLLDGRDHFYVYIPVTTNLLEYYAIGVIPQQYRHFIHQVKTSSYAQEVAKSYTQFHEHMKMDVNIAQLGLINSGRHSYMMSQCAPVKRDPASANESGKGENFWLSKDNKVSLIAEGQSGSTNKAYIAAEFSLDEAVMLTTKELLARTRYFNLQSDAVSTISGDIYIPNTFNKGKIAEFAYKDYTKITHPEFTKASWATGDVRSQGLPLSLVDGVADYYANTSKTLLNSSDLIWGLSLQSEDKGVDGRYLNNCTASGNYSVFYHHDSTIYAEIRHPVSGIRSTDSHAYDAAAALVNTICLVDDIFEARELTIYDLEVAGAQLPPARYIVDSFFSVAQWATPSIDMDGINLYLSGGATNQDWDSSLGGARSAHRVSSGYSETQVSQAQAARGAKVYRCIYLKNETGGTVSGLGIYTDNVTGSGGTVLLGIGYTEVNGVEPVMVGEGELPELKMGTYYSRGSPMFLPRMEDGDVIPIWVMTSISVGDKMESLMVNRLSVSQRV